MLKKLGFSILLSLSTASIAHAEFYCPPESALQYVNKQWQLKPEYAGKWNISIEGNPTPPLMGLMQAIGNHGCMYGSSFGNAITLYPKTIGTDPDKQAPGNSWHQVYPEYNGPWICGPVVANESGLRACPFKGNL